MGALDAVMSLLPRRAARRGRHEISRYDMNWYLRMLSDWQLGGGTYPANVITTYGKNPAEPIGESFTDYVTGGLQSNGIVFALELKRLQVFSQARFQFQHLRKGRPGDLWGDDTLRLLEEPWRGGTTGDMLARMILDADFAGNNFQIPLDGELVRVRPDWVEIVLAPRRGSYGEDGEDVTVGYKQLGILYYEGGIQAGAKPAVFLAGEYSHFAPLPDPLATYRGMSWLTPVIREIQSDTQATKHKLKFFENGATPNVVVSMPKELTFDQFKQFAEAMDRSSKGTENAYKTLYAGGGADVTVVGANMQQLDFKVTQGAGETRLAAAAGVHPVIAGLSEGMQGSSLNAGNYSSAKRSFVDTTCRHLWQNAAGSLQMIVPAPSGSRLWYDARDIPFLAEDMKDRADIMATNAQTVNSLTTAGYTSDSIIAAVVNEDFSLLVHSGLFSVQLQPPTTEQSAADASGAGPKVPAARAAAARNFDPLQPRNPHTGEWIDTHPGDWNGAKFGLAAIGSAPVSLGNMDEKLSDAGLSDQEIFDVQDAFFAYQDRSYRDINRLLLGTVGSDEEVQAQIDLMDIAFDASPMEHDAIVYRGERNPSRHFAPGEWNSTGGMEGKEWTFAAYASTSADVSQADHFATFKPKGRAAPEHPTVVKILVPKGTRAINLAAGSASHHEQELLLHRGLRYRIVRDHGVVDGLRRLDVVVIS